MRIAIALGTVLLAATTLTGGAAVAQDFDLMQFADPNGDGKVTLEEFTAFSAQGWDYFAQGGDSVKVADLDPMAKPSFVGVPTDAAGMATKAAYTAAVPARFKAADKNGDGSLTKAELEAALAPKP